VAETISVVATLVKGLEIGLAILRLSTMAKMMAVNFMVIVGRSLEAMRCQKNIRLMVGMCNDSP
jgi:hypothetical protein